jgi:hypothetical protein
VLKTLPIKIVSKADFQVGRKKALEIAEMIAVGSKYTILLKKFRSIAGN